jgi:K(+)-stimulated pyrophosphate-energized sodium pump
MFIAYGVAMAGIGMLTLTGNTISMDVFGPVASHDEFPPSSRSTESDH